MYVPITKERRLRLIGNSFGSAHGKPFRAFVCDNCCYDQSYQSKHIPDSGRESWMCSACGHNGIGSMYNCIYGDWLWVWIIDEVLEEYCNAKSKP
jgi:hypothetical protein